MILVIGNVGFHITIPNNIKFLRVPPYAPELNLAEKVWQYMKSKEAMKFNESNKRFTRQINPINKINESKVN